MSEPETKSVNGEAESRHGLAFALEDQGAGDKILALLGEVALGLTNNHDEPLQQTEPEFRLEALEEILTPESGVTVSELTEMSAGSATQTGGMPSTAAESPAASELPASVDQSDAAIMPAGDGAIRIVFGDGPGDGVAL